jgi:hypothetical protein
MKVGEKGEYCELMGYSRRKEGKMKNQSFYLDFSRCTGWAAV